MPSGGQKRIWQYNFMPPPVTLLDLDWDGLDRQWEHDIVERLGREEAAPRGVSVYDLVQSMPGGAGGGWEGAEEHSKDANRIGAAFLNDEAIAARLPARKLQKEAYAELQAKLELEKPQREAEKARREAEEVERRKADVEWRRRLEERVREQAERKTEWERIEKELAEERRAEAEVKQSEDWQRLGTWIVTEKQRIEADRIFSNRWQCQRCRGLKIKVEAREGRYFLECKGCGVKASGDHKTLVKMLP
jgi:hypothetical protein